MIKTKEERANEGSEKYGSVKNEEHRKHTPIVSEAEARFFGAELARKKAGEKGKTDMDIPTLERHLREWGRKNEKKNTILEGQKRYGTEIKNEINPDILRWIESTLISDKVSSDQELIQLFVSEAGLDEAQAKALVSKRQFFQK